MGETFMLLFFVKEALFDILDTLRLGLPTEMRRSPSPIFSIETMVAVKCEQAGMRDESAFRADTGPGKTFPG
jgi:hypothetical protein